MVAITFIRIEFKVNQSGFIPFVVGKNPQITNRGFILDLEQERFRVEVIKTDLLRMKISRGGNFDESPSHALQLSEQQLFASSPDFKTEVLHDEVVLTTANLKLIVGLSPFSVDVYRADGSAVFETYRDSAGKPHTYESLNDAFVVRRCAGASDPIYGLGEKTGKQNRRGRDFTLWNTDVLNPTAAGVFTAGLDSGDPRADQTSTEFDPYYMSIPFFYHQSAESGAMAGSYIDNTYRAHYDFKADDYFEIKFFGGQYTEYVFAGPSMAAILADYSWLTGRTQLPPIWALGYHQCRWKAYDQDSFIALADKHRELDIPVDTLWLDIDYMRQYRVFTWNNDLFPNVKQMLSDMRSRGIRVITIIDPGVKFDPGYEVFDSGIAEDVFCKTEGGDTYIGQVWPGNTAFPDFTLQRGREWWGKLNAEHVQSGLAGIWNDMNEPATGSIAPERMLFSDGKYSHERYHNEYATLMAMGTVDGLRAAMPNLRTFVLSRAGSPGIQRYAANWMGDNMSRWDHLWMSMPMAAGIGISGQSFVGADIGGFAEDCTPELFTRWIQYGALTPFARNHNVINQADQYAFSFGDDVLGVARDAIKLRYRLLPYLYTAFTHTVETGEPVQRPLIFDYQGDEAVREIDDQYLFGRDLLVAPIFAAKQTKREVYLPAGEWIDWHSGESFRGPATISVNAPLDRIPLFAKAGSVIPMHTAAPATTADFVPTEITLRVQVPSADSVSTSWLQEDDGLTFSAESGSYVRTELTLSRSGNLLTLSGKTQGDGFPEFARKKFILQFHGATELAGTQVEIDNAGEAFEYRVQLG